MPDKKTIAVDRDLLVSIQTELNRICGDMKGLQAPKDGTVALSTLKVGIGKETFAPGAGVSKVINENATDLAGKLKEMRTDLNDLVDNIGNYLTDVGKTESANVVDADDLRDYLGSSASPAR